MSFVKTPSLFASFVWRLTFVYTIVFALVLTVTTLALYTFMKKNSVAEVDRFLSSEISELKGTLNKGGITALAKDISDEANEIGRSRIFFRLHSLSDGAIRSSDLSSWIGLEKPDFASVEKSGSTYLTYYLPSLKGDIRVGYFKLSHDLILEVGQSMVSINARLWSSFELLGILALAATLLSMLFGYLMVKRAMHRVDALTDLARSIGQTNLSSRVPVSGKNDEIERLAVTFNSMLDGIAGLVQGLKQVIEDLSHELRTPLTRLRLEAESMLRRKTSDQEINEFGYSVIEETDSLVSTITDILDISEAESKIAKLEVVPFDVVERLSSIASMFETLAQEKQITIQVVGISFYLIYGDINKLDRVFSNLIDNSIKYNKKGGQVKIVVSELSNMAQIAVVDSGIGINKDQLPLVFDRFFRAKESKTYPGNGLGLSLVKAIVEVHGGSVTAAKSDTGEGSIFTVLLPKPQTLPKGNL